MFLRNPTKHEIIWFNAVWLRLIVMMFWRIATYRLLCGTDTDNDVPIINMRIYDVRSDNTIIWHIQCWIGTNCGIQRQILSHQWYTNLFQIKILCICLYNYILEIYPQPQGWLNFVINTRIKWLADKCVNDQSWLAYV